MEGLDRGPRAFIGLLNGENRGNILVKVGGPVRSFEGSLVQNAIYIAGERRVAGRARGLGGGARRRSSILAPSGTSRAAPAARRRCARTSRRSSGGGCGRGCSPGTTCVTSPSRCSGTRSAAPFWLGARRRPLDRARREGGRRGARRGGDRRPVRPLECGLVVDRGGRRGDGRCAALVPALLDQRPGGGSELRAARRGGGLRRDRRHARHADARLAAARPRQGVLPFLSGEGCAQFFTDPVFRAKLSAPPEEDVLDGRGDDARDVPEPRPDVGRPRLAARADVAAAARQGRAPRRGRAAARASTASTGSSSRTTAGVRSTARSRRSTRLSRCARRSGRTTPPRRRRDPPGADVVKAMALGADAVLLGRLYAYGLAVGGAAGVGRCCGNCSRRSN